MRLDQLYRTGGTHISIELFPPKTARGISQLFERVEQMRACHPAFFSMTYGAAGTTRDLTLSLLDRLKNGAQVETMCHLTVVGQSRHEIRQILGQLKQLGVYNLIALRGDPPKGSERFVPHPEGFVHAAELVREANQHGDFAIAVAGYPEAHPESASREQDIFYLKQKVEAGACVIVTQLFFDNDYYFDYVEAVRRAGITVPVIPGILPIISVPQVRRFTALCKSTIPAAVQAELCKYEDDDEAATLYGIELATTQCEALVAAGVPGLHFYSLNRSRSVEAVIDNLGFAEAM